MPLRETRRDSGERFRLEPVGRGIDLRTSPTLIGSGTLRRIEHARSITGAIKKRLGAVKVSSVSPNNYGVVFGADTKYGTVAAAEQLRLTRGGFFLFFHFTAVRPAAGKTAYLWSNHVSGAAHGSVWPTLNEDGELTVSMRTAAGATVSLTSPAIVANATVHALVVFDAVALTFRLYIDGEQVATTSTSLATDTQPIQNALDWYFGVLWDPGSPGVTADTHFDGQLDAFALGTLRGSRVAEGDPSPLDVLREHSLQTWPNPMDPRILAFYDFDEGTGTTAHDRSDHKNHMTLVGGATFAAGIAYRAAPANLIAVADYENLHRENLWGVGGNLYYETMRGAVT